MYNTFLWYSLKQCSASLTGQEVAVVTVTAKVLKFSLPLLLWVVFCYIKNRPNAFSRIALVFDVLMWVNSVPYLSYPALNEYPSKLGSLDVMRLRDGEYE